MLGFPFASLRVTANLCVVVNFGKPDGLKEPAVRSTRSVCHLPRLAAAIVMLAALPVCALDQSAAVALMKKHKCASCHVIDRKNIGPAYVDVAARHKDDKDAAAKLAKKVKNGGGGVWGPIPMPPNNTVPDADLEALVGWILTLKK
jgi:cytochrome c